VLSLIEIKYQRYGVTWNRC